MYIIVFRISGLIRPAAVSVGVASALGPSSLLMNGMYAFAGTLLYL
jgi:hypothetical protein